MCIADHSRSSNAECVHEELDRYGSWVPLLFARDPERLLPQVRVGKLHGSASARRSVRTNTLGVSFIHEGQTRKIEKINNTKLLLFSPMFVRVKGLLSLFYEKNHLSLHSSRIFSWPRRLTSKTLCFIGSHIPCPTMGAIPTSAPPTSPSLL